MDIITKTVFFSGFILTRTSLQLRARVLNFKGELLYIKVLFILNSSFSPLRLWQWMQHRRSWWAPLPKLTRKLSKHVRTKTKIDTFQLVFKKYCTFWTWKHSEGRFWPLAAIIGCFSERKHVLLLCTHTYRGRSLCDEGYVCGFRICNWWQYEPVENQFSGSWWEEKSFRNVLSSQTHINVSGKENIYHKKYNRPNFVTEQKYKYKELNHNFYATTTENCTKTRQMFLGHYFDVSSTETKHEKVTITLMIKKTMI